MIKTSTAYIEGYRARLSGQDIRENPYGPVLEVKDCNSNRWQHGWLQADCDMTGITL